MIARFEPEGRATLDERVTRAAEPGGALVPLRAQQRARAGERPPHPPGRDDRRARRPPRLPGGRRPRPVRRAPARRSSSRASRASGTSRSATGSRSAAATSRARSSASRSRPTTSRTRWRAPPACTWPSGSRARRRRTSRCCGSTTRSKADVTLTQARAVSFGLGRLEFVTREGVKVLLGQAAGIVISLLVAFSLVALVAAGTMLAAGAHADVQRRLGALGVQRALGFSPARIAALQATEAALVAVPAAAAGIGLGALAVAGPAAALLAALNELPPGGALLLPLLARAGRRDDHRGRRRDVAGLARRAAAAGRDPPRRHDRGAHALVVARPAAGLAALGARFATAARARWIAAVATIGVCAGVVTLMLALASLLERLRDDPGTVGKRYQLTVQLDASFADDVRAIPGVADAAPRYVAEAADSYRLDKPFRRRRLPGRPHAVRGAAARGRPAAAQRGRGRGRARAGRRARAAAGLGARRPAPGRRRGPLPRRGRRARAREQRADRVGAPGPARRPRAVAGRAARRRRRPARRSSARSRRSARRRSRSAGRRRATPPSSACSPRCCAASASPSGSSASTRSSRRWP